MHTLTFTSEIGPITITETDNAITRIDFRAERTPGKGSPLLRQCATQIREYLAGKRHSFDVPLRIDGTAFDRAVLAAMRMVAFGKTVSYASLAKAIGKPTAYRAVANACGRNKIPILIPCHRVVASDGIGGFNAGISRKKALLRIERTI